MPDFSKLWDKIYLLGPNPIAVSRSDKVFFGLAIIFIAVAIAAKFTSRNQNAASPKAFLLNRVFHLLLTTGILVAVWYAARFENIPWLSTHVVVLFLFLIWAVWAGFIVKYFYGVYGVQYRKWEEEQVKRKYLP